MWDADEPRGARRATMPTALERAGDFSQTLDVSGRVIPVIDPLTGQPFPGNRIPANRINANGQAILNLFPEPNFFDRSVSGGNYNYNDQDVATLGRTLDQLKVDHTLSDREKLSVRWRRWRPITEAYSGVFAVNSNWNHFRNGYAQQEDSVLVNHTRTLGGAIVNEASMSFRYTGGSRTDSRFDYADDALGTRPLGSQRAVSGGQQRRHHSSGDLRGRARHGAVACLTISAFHGRRG